MEGRRWGDGGGPGDATSKCIFLTTSFPWFFAKVLAGQRCGSHIVEGFSHCAILAQSSSFQLLSSSNR